ncbi:sigma-70 family RNA polymerase sigma factor [Mycobacterium hodleri]|uniref:sigma-70 family RNA polymerase sigma factor n=1 Tax=Mycolicibacterium hodleri TaxID=49897 RepID=UPI0021F312F7|nr:sigma-70 family RNA polymerase sigma factor [Mycolicibacterium hodleri]MCV7133644.1 sigma-70 family RNA polymerase sigma factor [Mycolicibacterium hodleri]
MDRRHRPPGTPVDRARRESGDDIQLHHQVPLEDHTVSDTDRGLVEQWLGGDDAKLTADRKRLERLAADEEALLELQLNNFAGDPWERFAREMARYGVGVLHSWIIRGVVYNRVKALTTFGLPRPLDSWPDDETAYDLAVDTVIDALFHFQQKVLPGGGWQSSRGASLGTFFIGQCLYRFANRYRAALRAEIARITNTTIPAGDLLPDSPTPVDGVERTVIGRDELNTTLGRISTDRAVKALLLHAQGDTYRQIAEQLGLTDAKQVENLIAYQRKNHLRRTS